MYYVYVLSSIGRTNELYIGSTNDLKSRIKAHNDGKSSSTKRYLPWKLIYYEAYETEALARMREQKLKYHGNAIKELKKRIGWDVEKGFIQHHSNGAGFTFMEILVASGIIALISAVSAQVFLTSSRNAVKSDLISNIKQNGDIALEVMTRMIQSARSISACTGAPSSSLAIENQDYGNTTFGCVLDGTVTRIASGSAYLTTAGLTLGGPTCAESSLTFLCTPNSGLPSSVRINFSLSQIGEPVKNYEKATVPFQSTVTVRTSEQL